MKYWEYPSAVSADRRPDGGSNAVLIELAGDIDAPEVFGAMPTPDMECFFAGFNSIGEMLDFAARHNLVREGGDVGSGWDT